MNQEELKKWFNNFWNIESRAFGIVESERLKFLSGILKLESILETVAKQIYPDGVSPDVVKDLQREHPEYDDIDYLIQSGKIVSAGHVYQPGNNPLAARNEIVRDILSGKEVSIKTDIQKNGRPVCYSVTLSDDLEPKLRPDSSVLLTAEDISVSKQKLLNLQKTLADIGDTSGDSAEYKEMKQGIQNAIDRFDNICTEGGYKRLMSDLSDCASKYYFAKVDQSMNSRRSKRFQIAEALYYFTGKPENRAELYKNRIAAKLAAANLHELTKRSDWMADRAKLMLGSKDRFNAIVDLVKKSPDFQTLVSNKSEKQLAGIFEYSASKFLSSASISGKAIVNNLRVEHIKEKAVDRTYKNSEAAIKGVQQFTNKLERLSGPKDAKLFTEMKEQLDETLMNLKYTTDEQAALDNINALRAKSMKYFTEKISEGMTKSRPDRIRTAMAMVNSIDGILGKKENSMLFPSSERGIREIMLAARLSRQTLTMASKKGPDAELANKILNNPDSFMKNVNETLKSAAFQGFVSGKTDAELDKMLSMSPSDLVKKSMKDTPKPQRQIRFDRMKALGDYVYSQGKPEPFTTSDALQKLNSVKNNPLNFSVARRAAVDMCKAKMLMDGYSIEDICDTGQLGEVKRKYAKEVFGLIKTGNAKELLKIMEYGCREFSAKINEMLDQMPSLDDEVISDPKYKNLADLGQSFKDLHQEFKNIPDEFKTQEDKILINDLSLSVDSLGRFTQSVADYIGCAKKILDGDKRLRGQLDSAFVNDIAQHKCVNSIFKEMKSSKDYDHVIIHSLVNDDGSEKQALSDLIKVKLYCSLEFGEDDLLDGLETSSEIKSFGEKLYDGTIGLDIVLDDKAANGIKVINGDKLERTLQQTLANGQKTLC